MPGFIVFEDFDDQVGSTFDVSPGDDVPAFGRYVDQVRHHDIVWGEHDTHHVQQNATVALGTHARHQVAEYLLMTNRATALRVVNAVDDLVREEVILRKALEVFEVQTRHVASLRARSDTFGARATDHDARSPLVDLPVEK